MFALNELDSLDLSLKYLHSTVAGRSATVASDPIRFDRMDSHRARLNAEFARQYSPTLTLQAGLGVEYEFDGKVEGTTYGLYAIDAPEVRGATGILTFGAKITPADCQRLSFDLRASAYAGKREGASAAVRMNYSFELE